VKKAFLYLGWVVFLIMILYGFDIVCGKLYNSSEFMKPYKNGKMIVEQFTQGYSDISISQPHPYILYTPMENYVDGKGHKQSNSAGYRNNYDIDVPKKEGVYRILALGGSTTHSFPYVTEIKDTWCGRLEQMLKDSLHMNIEVVNAGLSNYTSAEQLSGYIFRHRYINPDMVIIHNGGNDAGAQVFEHYDPEYKHWRISGSGWIPRLYENKLLRSGFFKLFYSMWLKYEPSVYRASSVEGTFIEMEPSKVAANMKKNSSNEGYSRNMDLLISLIRADSAKVVTVPFIYASYDKVNESRVVKNKAESLVEIWKLNEKTMSNLSEIYQAAMVARESVSIDDSLFLDHCHLGSQGDSIKANKIFQTVKQHIRVGES
jgi:lysophospholipase L1-like esterase